MREPATVHLKDRIALLRDYEFPAKAASVHSLSSDSEPGHLETVLAKGFSNQVKVPPSVACRELKKRGLNAAKPAQVPLASCKLAEQSHDLADKDLFDAKCEADLHHNYFKVDKAVTHLVMSLAVAMHFPAARLQGTPSKYSTIK